jgi:hypothetical protein
MLATGLGRAAALACLASGALAVPLAAAGDQQSATAPPNKQPSAPPTVPVTNVESHGPFSGTPTTTGALSTKVLAASIAPKPPQQWKLAYPANGKLTAPQPAPYTPHGGVGTNGTEPVYKVQSDFDYESLALGLYQEYIELDLFHWGLATFSEKDFEDAGLTAEDRFLIQFMAEQEVGHATALTNLLGGPGSAAPRQCTYNYPVTNVREYLDFCQKLTRFGEAGVYGFLNHLDSREAGQILLQSITTEARQQLIFRQFSGLFPMPVWFEVGIPQSWAWTLLAPYISSCPANQTRLVWQNFPSLNILNQPNPARVKGSDAHNETTGGYTNTLSTKDIPKDDLCANSDEVGVSCKPAITRNRTEPLSYPGRKVLLEWDAPGKAVGPNNSYVTTTSAGKPAFAAWVTQLNVTYSALENVTDRSASTVQPDVSTFASDPAINGTIFLALTDTDLFVTPFNLTMINPHVVALGMYQAG